MYSIYFESFRLRWCHKWLLRVNFYLVISQILNLNILLEEYSAIFTFFCMNKNEFSSSRKILYPEWNLSSACQRKTKQTDFYSNRSF
jgi:hypothetical protein